MNISKCKCGGNAIIRQDHFSVSYGDWKIFCEKCGMQTGWTKNKEDAIEIWNRTMDASDINVGHKFDKDINVPIKVTIIVEPFTTDMTHVGYCMCGYLVNAEWYYCPKCGRKIQWGLRYV